ncbi:MAG TPA: OmpA family protein [Candidatus Bathyarchaeia archaeon]|nr:OmpA family protein [Candidatus Bathyarchaeia archaeon]
MRSTTFIWMALALAPLGCATQQQLLEVETQLKARIEKTETALATEKARVDKLTTDLAAVRATADEGKRIGTEATAMATDARQRADAAAAKGEAVDARVTKALTNRLARTKVQEFQVTFQTGRTDLSPGDEQTLLEAAKLLGDNPTYTVDLIGHTDDVGMAGSNVNLSWRREEMVRRFMVESGIALNRFSFIGLGEDRASGTSSTVRAKERHVSIVVYRPAE